MLRNRFRVKDGWILYKEEEWKDPEQIFYKAFSERFQESFERTNDGADYPEERSKEKTQSLKSQNVLKHFNNWNFDKKNTINVRQKESSNIRF